jgi:hypothetical protein
VDQSIKVRPHGIGMAISWRLVAIWEVNTKLAVVELGAIAQVGACHE